MNSPSQTADFAAVSTLRLFAGVDVVRLNRVLADCGTRDCAAGSILLQAGESNDAVYFVLDGELRVKVGEGEFAIGPGECFGEMSVVDGRKVSAQVLAGEATRLLVVPGRVFWEELITLPNVARNVFAMMVQRLRAANEGLLAEQRQRIVYEHLQREIAAAREIQSSMMPSRLKLFPGHAELDCAGAMFPAVDVAGDFFDACMLSDTQMYFAVGDVSGKGVSAALLMAKTVPLLRLEATRRRSIPEVIAAVNDTLCENNPRCMFVTLGCGILDLASGALAYGNAGHVPPVVLRGSDARCLEVPEGMALGAMPGETYELYTTRLVPGELLLLYSDGVTEAFDARQEAFGIERLLETVRSKAGEGATQVVSGVKAAVDGYTRGVKQSDDIALFAARYLGAGG